MYHALIIDGVMQAPQGASRAADGEHSMSDKGFPLAMAGEGERVVIARVVGGGALQKRLLDLGLSVGKTLEVVNRQGRGGLVVSIGETRLALGFGVTEKVIVVPAGSAAP